MRLLTTQEPWRFVETYEAPPYAILSHTWMTTSSGESLEVSYQELRAYMEKPKKRAAVAAKPGFEKIKKAIKYAAREEHELIWIDTCCIDKTNQLELDEAIRCMFKWYQDAAICYAYLSDVETRIDDDLYGQVRSSRWFTRGWTLQELVAPRNVVFLTKNWGCIGNRLSEGRFGEVLCEASGISEDVLYGIFDTSEISISERMRWAARRKTTRVEDMAYSLMGIFGVHMPIMYGEGKDAFVRLQKEILRNSDDPSIFAWTSPYENHDQIRGLLADSPACFADAKNLQQSNGFDASPDEWQDTNRGIRLQLLMHPCKQDGGNTDYFAHLDCFYNDFDAIKRPMLRLRHLGGGEFARVHATRIFWRMSDDPEPSAERRILFVKQTPLYRQPELIVAQENLSQQETDSIFGFTLQQVYPQAFWNGIRFHNAKDQSSKPQPAIFRFSRSGGSEYCVDVAIGFSNEGLEKWKPWYIQRRCSDELENIGRVYKLVCQEMAAYTVGTFRPSCGGASFGWHIYSRVTLAASRSSTDSLSYTIRVESPAELCSLPLESIRAKHIKIGCGDFVPETSLDPAYEEMTKNICALSTPLAVKWTPLAETISDETPANVVRVGPRDYSPIVRLSSGIETLPSLHQAAVDGDVETVRTVYRTCDNALSTLDGWSACHMAAAMAHGSVVEWFLKQYASLAVYKDKDAGLAVGPCSQHRYESIFHIVAGVPNIPAGDFLLTRSFWKLYAQRAGRREVRNFLGETPLHRAAAAGNLDVVTILVDLCIGDVEAVDVNRRTPLWHAAAAGHGEIVECLIASKPRTGDLYREDSFGVNELHIACWYNHKRVVHSLLSHTTKPHVPSSKFGFTPAHFAYYGDSIACIEILEYFDVDMDACFTSSQASTSPKDMKGFAEKALEYYRSGFPSHAHMKNFTSVPDISLYPLYAELEDTQVTRFERE